MADAAQPASIRTLSHQERLARVADGLAAAVAASLPWSTTATSILLVLWLAALLPTLDRDAIRRIALVSAAMMPIALCMLGVLGVLWADAPLSEKLFNLKVFPRLAVIALLMIQFQRSDRGHWVLVAFLASCTVLLIPSWVHWLITKPSPRIHPGVPVKDYVFQSIEFLLCAFALLHLMLNALAERRYLKAVACGGLAFAFLINIAYVATGRTTLVVAVVFVVIFAFQRFRWKGAVGVIVVAGILSAATWWSSPYLRARVLAVSKEVHHYQTKQIKTSSGYRLEFWKKSIEIVSQAPIVGHGTGSIDGQFRRAAIGTKGIVRGAADNPHNQTFVVAIQLGLVGVVLLYAMWLALFVLFRGSGFVPWLGTGLVAQNAVSGLFNSYVFEHSLGWLFIIGAGVLGGMMLRSKDETGCGR